MKLLLIIIAFCTLSNLYAPIHTGDIIAEYELRVKQRKEAARQAQIDRFLNAIALSESAGKYHVYNKYGYIGRYQFGYSARKATGYGNIHFSDFVKNPEIWKPEDQDAAMIRLLKINEKHLSEVIKLAETGNLTIRGVQITKSGILAGAHLAGFAGVKRYFAHNYNAKDVYGTSVEDYILKFSGYDI
jgi:hypothetical protein